MLTPRPRPWRLILAVLVSLLAVTPALARDTAAELRAFAFKAGLERVDEFLGGSAYAQVSLVSLWQLLQIK